MARKISFSIEFDGQPVAQVNHLWLSHPLFGHHAFEVHTPIWEKANVLSQVADSFIGKNMKVELTSGIAGSGGKTFFQGIITSVGLSKNHGAIDEIVYKGYGPTILMDDGPHCQSFLDMSQKDIVDSVFQKYGVSGENNPGHSDPIPYFVQYRESGYQLLARMANLYGEWFYYDGAKVIYGKPVDEDPISLNFGIDLDAFDLDLNLSPSKYKMLGYDYLNHQYPDSPASAATVNGLNDYGKIVARISDEIYKNEPAWSVPYDLFNKSDLDAVSQYYKSGIAGNYVVFKGASSNYRLKLGAIISVKGQLVDVKAGMLDTDYGEYRIIELNHFIDGAGDYSNHFKAIPSQLECPPNNPAIRVPYCEIQPAEVLENHDPDELGRVEVQCWWQKPTGDKTPWIRVAASGAGSGHGAYFVPEKGDQVLVGFEHNNPNKPYVIGSLFHGKSKPEGVADPDNNKKSLKTKSGNQIVINDEGGKEEIKIENGTNVITLSLSGSGSISISSSGDISLSAANISINAGENITLGAKKITANGEQEINLKSSDKLDMDGASSAKLTGAAVNVEASGNAVVKGSGGTEVSSPATVKVNGQAMVTVEGGTIKLN